MLTEVGASEMEECASAALSAKDFELAATLILRALGPEILRFFLAIHRDVDDTGDVFSAFTEALWKGIPSFERRSSFRTWAYSIARRVSLRYRRDARRRRTRFEASADSETLAAIEAQVRTETLSFLRTERRTKLTMLRESLSPEDQMLLILRVDRRLAWIDLAIVLGDEESDPPSREVLKREVARLRKRFQMVKERLREMGRKEGLLTAARQDR